MYESRSCHCPPHEPAPFTYGTSHSYNGIFFFFFTFHMFISRLARPSSTHHGNQLHAPPVITLRLRSWNIQTTLAGLGRPGEASENRIVTEASSNPVSGNSATISIFVPLGKATNHLGTKYPGKNMWRRTIRKKTYLTWQNLRTIECLKNILNLVA